MPRFGHSIGVSTGLHAAAIGLVILTAYYFHQATPLPPSNTSLANAIAVSVTPPPQPPIPAQPPQPKTPPAPPVLQPPPQTISTQAEQAPITMPPKPAQPLPQPTPPAPAQATPQQASYAQIVSAILKKNKRYPRQAILAGQEGTVVISFILNREGTVLAYSIKQSSGHAALDQAVQQLMQRVHFPPFPPGDASQRKTFSVPIEFTLSG